MTRPGVTVRTRSAFVPASAEKAVANRMELALVTPEARGDFDILVSVGQAVSKGLGRREAPLEARIPLSALTFRNVGERMEAVVDVAIAAVEDTGARSDVSVQRRTISLPSSAWETGRGRDYLFTASLKSGNRQPPVRRHREGPWRRTGWGSGPQASGSSSRYFFEAAGAGGFGVPVSVKGTEASSFFPEAWSTTVIRSCSRPDGSSRRYSRPR